MSDLLPENFDVVVIGTGLVESIVAAACARAGKNVLHIDSNHNYGHLWACFNLDELEKWAESVKTLEKTDTRSNEADKITLQNEKCILGQISGPYFNPEPTSEPTQKDHVMMNFSRKFNFDLFPKFVFAADSMVNTLLKSRVARYIDFLPVKFILTSFEGKVLPVPSSREEVFSSEQLTRVEKRIIMRVIQDVIDGKQGVPDDTLYADYLEKSCNPLALHCLLFIIAMSDRTTSFHEAAKRTKLFANSTERYCHSPFIWPLYGCSEIAQGFCRLCAVFGGTYYLSININSIKVEGGQCSGIQTENQFIRCSNIVTSKAHLYNDQFKTAPRIARGILVTTKSLLEEKNTVILARIETSKGKCVTVLELPPSSGACPNNFHVVHLTAEQVDDPESDFKEVVDILFGVPPPEPTANTPDENETPEESVPPKPKILFSLFFSIVDTSKTPSPEELPGGLYTCSGPCSDPDFDCLIEEAKGIFLQMYPDEEFFPPVPDEPEQPPQEEEVVAEAPEPPQPVNDSEEPTEPPNEPTEGNDS